MIRPGEIVGPWEVLEHTETRKCSGKAKQYFRIRGWICGAEYVRRSDGVKAHSRQCRACWLAGRVPPSEYSSDDEAERIRSECGW